MKYSIITINYNNRDGLRKTIESVIHQTYHDFEYIVIDGGSTDGSVDVLKEYDKNIDYWVSEPDKGIYNAMNKGIAQAHGEYLNFMNSGDCFNDKEVLNMMLPFLFDDIVHGKQYEGSTNSISFMVSDIPTMRYLYESSLRHQSCFIRRVLFKDSLYDEHYRIVSDWKFFIEKIIFQNCTFCFAPVVVASFEGNGISSQLEELNRKEREEVLNSLLPPRILQDYAHYKGKESPILELIPQFNKTYRLQKFIILTIKCILRCYYLFIFKKK